MFKKIRTKIFVIILLIVVLILSIQVLFQTFVLEDFYIDKEIERVKLNVSELSNKISEIDYNARNKSAVLKGFIENNNDTIVTGNMEFKASKSIDIESLEESEFELVVKSEKDKLYYVSLASFDIDSSNKIIEGDNIVIDGSLFEGNENYLFAKSIDVLDVNYNHIETIHANLSEYEVDYPEEFSEELISRVIKTKITGRVLFNSSANLFEQINYENQSRLYKAVEKLFDSTSQSDNYDKLLSDYKVGNSNYNISEDSSGKYLLYVEKVAYKSGETTFVYSFTVLKQIEDTIVIFNSYMWVTVGMSILISFLGSIVISRYLSKPIVEINDVATKISNLDFSEEVKYRSNDEIGNLGSSLNIMASQLESKIGELEGMNEELSSRLEYKTKQENIRKDFVASVSHELKTPITVMKGFIEGIRDGLYKGDKHDDAMLTIYNETQTMEELIIKMLSLSKLEAEESSHLTYNSEAFDLESEILMLLYRYKALISNNAIEVVSNISESIVSGDNEKIQLVLDNLISNAVKYTSRGGKIFIDIVDLGSKFEVAIENECDLDENIDLDDMWKAFYKVDKSGNKAIAGTGLGLAIVKKILELHASEYTISRTENTLRIGFTLEKASDNLE